MAMAPPANPAAAVMARAPWGDGRGGLPSLATPGGAGVNPCTAYFDMSPAEEAAVQRSIRAATDGPAAAPPIQFWQGHGWDVTHRSDTKILAQDRVARWESELGVTALPEMLYGASFLTLRHAATGTSLHFDAHDALAAAARGAGDAPDAELFKCEFHAAWQRKKGGASAAPRPAAARAGYSNPAAASAMPPPPPPGEATDEMVTHDAGIDWTYRTPYAGTLRRLPSPDPPPPAREGEGEIAWELLQDRSAPILCYSSLELFEDELADCGRSKLSLKFRFMPSCWFVLLRQFVRVDRVRVWIRDVRMFHRHGAPHVVEETTVRSMPIGDMSGRAEDLALAEAAADGSGAPPKLRTYNDIDQLAQTTPVIGKVVRAIPL